tara:strand:- start:59 stop:406 length:348 start_codon:yes stop_codon:yes gene_type:complete
MKKLTTECPLERSLEVISGKWKICILTKLSKRKYRFGEIRRAIGDITVKMLSQQLKELERSELISRKDFGEVPPKVEYSITDFGLTLSPILEQIEIWGVKNKTSIDKYLKGVGKI